MDRRISLGSNLDRDGLPWEVGWTQCLLENLVRMKREVVLVPPPGCRRYVTSGYIKHLERAVTGRLLKTPALVFHLSGASPEHHGQWKPLSSLCCGSGVSSKPSHAQR